MIHIKYPGGRTPNKAWEKKALELTEQLKKAPNKAARDKIIDDNAAFWGKLKSWLEDFSYGKCWFSEARDTCSHWQVEHFRPKKEVKDPGSPNNEGYWWLAFNYRNYRLCGGVVNAKKGSYFPLRPATTAATCPDDNCDDEAPLLIDPTVLSDVRLLTFAEGGQAVPSVQQNVWDRHRALKSIERYKLNEHPALSRARQTVWNECRQDAEKIEILLAEQNAKFSPSREQDIKNIMERLSERTVRHAQFSSVARAFLLQYPEEWARRLIV